MTRFIQIFAIFTLFLLIPQFLHATDQTTVIFSEYDSKPVSIQSSVKPNPKSAVQTKQTQKADRNLLEMRKKRDLHKYQTPPTNLSNAKEITVKAHAYCLRGLTSRGVHTRVGVIAVDPKVIPYGSKIYIPGYGWGTALDTGGAIQGKTIDIWMPTYGQCMQWGTRHIKVKVVTPK